MHERLTAAGLSAQLSAGLDLRAVTELALAQAVAPVFIAVTRERARAEAAASVDRHRSGRPHGPLDGVPVAYKDVIDVAGTMTTAGSLTTSREIAQADAECVRRLRAAGTVCIGTTNLSEFAFSGLGLNPHFGTPENPHAPDRVPGGSSAGSAVAVATGAVAFALGTDTSGSVRVPAAFLGLVGFRPTQARYSRSGVFALAASLDTVGTLAHTVDDVVTVDSVLYRRQLAQPAETVVVPEGPLTDGLETAVAQNFESMLRALERAGVRIVRRPVPAMTAAQSAMDDYGSLVPAQAYGRFAHLLDDPRLDPFIAARLRAGADADRGSLLAARPTLIAALTAQLGGAVIAVPTVRHVAPRRGPLEQDYTAWSAANTATLRTTMVGSYLDTPAISLPSGRDGQGLPTAVQLSGSPGDDALVLATARLISNPHPG